jgi:hypothetical protein
MRRHRADSDDSGLCSCKCEMWRTHSIHGATRHRAVLFLVCHCLEYTSTRPLPMGYPLATQTQVGKCWSGANYLEHHLVRYPYWGIFVCPLPLLEYPRAFRASPIYLTAHNRFRS